jgi:hypothetical protein
MQERIMTAKLTLIVAFLMLSVLWSCGNDSAKKKSSPVKNPATDQGENTINPNPVNPQTTAPVVITNENGKHPIIVVAGWGHKLPWNNHQTFMDRITADGFAKEDTFLMTYDDHATPDEINLEVAPKFNEIFAKYPANTKFDVWGISTGHFVGIYAIMQSGFDTRVRKYIAVAGIGHGMDSFYIPVVNIEYRSDKTGFDTIVGKTLAAISPYMNPFVSDFYNKYAARIQLLDKCSIFSKDDGFVTPYDSGKFADGKNFDIAGLKHLNSISEPGHYEAVKQNCYGGTIK